MIRAFKLAVLLLILASARLHAEASLQKVYEGLVSDPDLYTGEGVVNLSVYAGDAAKAQASARERARGSLVESIKVHVSSRVTDIQKSGPGGESQQVEASSTSTADLELENIQYRGLENFPKEGQLTVVASLAKVEYDRQMAGRRKNRFRPYWGLRVDYCLPSINGLQKFLDDETSKGRGGLPLKPGSGSVAGVIDPPSGFGLQFSFKEWSLSFEQAGGKALIYPYDPTDGRYQWDYTTLNITDLGLGWNYVPWATRFQPYVPLRARYYMLSIGDYKFNAPLISAGLGLRYWASESFYFDVSGHVIEGFGQAALESGNGPFFSSPGKRGSLDLSQIGTQFELGLTWTGF